MRNQTAKSLRKLAEKLTVGKTAQETKQAYKGLKRSYKAHKRGF